MNPDPPRPVRDPDDTIARLTRRCIKLVELVHVNHSMVADWYDCPHEECHKTWELLRWNRDAGD